MAALNELIQKIENPELRAQIQAAVDKQNKQKKFGLVFEEHLPECTPMYDIPVRKGSKVSHRNGKTNVTYTVLNIEDGIATCLAANKQNSVEFPVNELVTTAELGDPIYPYLQQLDEVCNAPDSDLWHTLIEADNYHALQLLEYLYAGKVDCIYIDPPYNTGAKDWKYNNNYVDETDEYRHSKWLSFMQKRLEIAKRLLNPSNSVLIVTIDEKEFLHLGCLLEEMFPEAKIQMISSVINPYGTQRLNEFSRNDEYIFFVMLGNAQPCGVIPEEESSQSIWKTFRRGDLASRRGAPKGGKSQFYPIYVDEATNIIRHIGDPIAHDIDRMSVESIPGCITVFPLRDDGTEMNWCTRKDSAEELHKKGYLKAGSPNSKTAQLYPILYLRSGTINDIETGKLIIDGYAKDNSIIAHYETAKEQMPQTNWRIKEHSARDYGTNLLKKVFDDKRFTFPKSVYAVEHCIRLFTSNNPNALIIDFFAGSGTTLHAVNLLNAEDGGNRRCIMVTNNEISEDERQAFEARNIKQGSVEWESRGIARYVTWPRTVCSIMGIDINGKKLKDTYITANTETISKKRTITQVPFVDSDSTLPLQDKKKLVQLISRKILPTKLVTNELGYVLSEDTKHTVSILLDDTYASEWLDDLSQYDHIEELFVITKDKKLFNRIKKQINDILPPLQQTITTKRPMAEGFKANAAFFKLGFLDKTKVSLGMQFKELLSTLWMKAGAIGKCPSVGEFTPDMLILPENRMAVLNDENYFDEFAEQLAQYPEIETVYLVTDYESSFSAMTQDLNDRTTYQLYRDYLDNFRINTGRNGR